MNINHKGNRKRGVFETSYARFTIPAKLELDIRSCTSDSEKFGLDICPSVIGAMEDPVVRTSGFGSVF